MFRKLLKIGMKSSILAYNKCKVGLSHIKENLEDLAAEVQSEVKAEMKTQSKHTHSTQQTHKPPSKQNKG